MNISLFRRLSVLLLLTLLFGAARADEAPTVADMDRVFARDTLQIATLDMKLHKFNIWIADDDQRRMRGLMFIRQLPEDQGMLFVYPQLQPVAMWMKNTYVSLDMLFVAADGRVVKVVEKTEPLSLKTIDSSNVPVVGVIELPAGSAAKLKIQRGARVLHAAFAHQ